MDRCGLSNDSINGMIVPLAQAQRLEELCLRTDIIQPRSGLDRSTVDQGSRFRSVPDGAPMKNIGTFRAFLISLKVEINLQMVIY